MRSIAGGSPRRLARIAGGLYLTNIVGGAFAIRIVPAMLIVQVDLVATARCRPTNRGRSRSAARGHAAEK